MLSVVLTFWFWLTPIFITEKQFPPWARFLLAANRCTTWLARTGRFCSARMPDLEDLAIAARTASPSSSPEAFFRHMKAGSPTFYSSGKMRSGVRGATVSRLA